MENTKGEKNHPMEGLGNMAYSEYPFLQWVFTQCTGFTGFEAKQICSGVMAGFGLYPSTAALLMLRWWFR